MSGMCREVVTLQLGHYSNFVGTHWWNLQDAGLVYDAVEPAGELQSDVMFREGQTLGGHVTYTPRLIAMDLKGSLQTLRKQGSLYDTENENTTSTWEGEIMTHKESPATKNPFLQDLDNIDMGGLPADPGLTCPSSAVDRSSGASVAMATVNSSLERVQKSYRLEGSVRVWSDFLRIHLHPRTVTVINQYNHDGESERLQAFGQGEALLQGLFLEDLEDRLHFFVEECDYLQGFQVLCDLADGFSGLGSKVTELLQDSYGGRGILTWGVAPVNHPDTSSVLDLYHMMNCALGTLNMANHSSFFCPLTLRGGLGRRPPPPTAFPLLNCDPALWFHSGSVLALALDCMTVPYRLGQGSSAMWQLSDALTASGRKVVSAYGSVPFPMMHGSCLPEALDAFSDALPWKPLSACPELGDGRCFGQSVTLRGLDGQRLVSAVLPGVEPPSPLHYERSGEDVLAAYVRSRYPSSPLAVQLLSSPSKLTPPFPQIFSPALGPQGFLQNRSDPADTGSQRVSGVPVLTSLQSGPAVGLQLSELQKVCSALDLRRVTPSFLSHGPEVSELSESLEQLRNLALCYRQDGSRSSSDEDD
ncbi:protein misato homolog 1-like [Pimephales promelas]|uniref:protein misato homolog 1-like n=1 Tax=Pimephales promelas TaxID=90988 RepID=UPI001955CEA3|nr:protein misato homolog 1-like [Pimephales promelas]KAG1929041.1 protein misato [Pimephales promelas]